MSTTRARLVFLTSYRNTVVNRKPRIFALDYFQAGTKVGPDQIGPPVRVRSTWIDSDHEKNIKLNEIETFTHLKVKIPVKSGPN